MTYKQLVYHSQIKSVPLVRMVKPIRVGPHGRTVRIDPQSRTPSTESDEIIVIYPQGEVHRDSGEEGDNGSVEDSPNRGRPGGVGVSDEREGGVAEASEAPDEATHGDDGGDSRGVAEASEAPEHIQLDGEDGVGVGVAGAAEPHEDSVPSVKIHSLKNI